MTRPVDLGCLVHIHYKDHAVFRNMDPETAKPIVQEAWGRLEYEDEECICLVVARYQEPNNDGKQEVRATGFVILKSTILEIGKVA